MPVQKEKKYEIAIKNLRRREIPCLVIAVPQKKSVDEGNTGSETHNDKNKNCSKILKCLKQRLNRTPATIKEKSKSLSYLDRKSEVVSKVTKRRVYRKKSLEIKNSPRKKNTTDVMNSTENNTDVMNSTKNTKDIINSTENPIHDTKPVANADTTKKRSRRKKSLEIKNSPCKKNTTDVMNSTENTSDVMNSTENTTDVMNTTENTIHDSEPVANADTTKKRSYRKKSLEIKNSPCKKHTMDVMNSTENTTDVMNCMENAKEIINPIENTIHDTDPVANKDTTKKRSYRKKVQVGVTITPIFSSPVSKSKVKTSFGMPVITPETPKKRVYRKKLRIPAVPHNTPVLCRASDNDSLSNTCFPQHSEVFTLIGKRQLDRLEREIFEHLNGQTGQEKVKTEVKKGRGRPRLSMPVVPLGSDTGDETTQSLGSDKGSTTRRARRSLWGSDSEEEADNANQVSEYELLRQRNIEENLKKLREIFDQQGLQFEEKTSDDAPKKRKSYSRVPLPPPRPRSQRIEIRKTFMPLDFSKLDEKLNMSEADFM